MTETHEIWDKPQEKVIQRPRSERCIIDAGPGTGKTAVACARVAWLIKEGVTPGNIWVISFTRTAVREIRSRIKKYVCNDGDTYAVKIATLDSHAWAIHYGFENTEKFLGTYDENIGTLTEMVQKDPRVIEYLRSSFAHLIIDEAQDIVGIRANLLLEIIRQLPSSCGVSVFADEAQAIYGWSLDDDEENPDKTIQMTLPQKIRETFGNKFRDCNLKTIFRTNDTKLKALFTDTRKKVLDTDSEVYTKHENVKNEVRNLAHDRVSEKIEKYEIKDPQNTFILFRRRAEVLLAAGFYDTKPHRIRMSGLPLCLHSWIGACLSEYTQKNLSKSDFISLWTKKVGASETSLNHAEDKWDLLVSNAGKNKKIVSMEMLRQLIGRKQPPTEFCYHEIGTKGPIIGTIHASKGREANEVCLLMPGSPGPDSDYDEETRVVFVGATRAKTQLHVGQGYNNHYATRLKTSGRVYKLATEKNAPLAMFEIGHEGDITASGIAGSKYYSDADQVKTLQKHIRDLAGKISPAFALADHGSGHIYRFKTGKYPDGEDLCCLSEALNSNLFDIGKEIKSSIGGSNRRPPNELKYLRTYGIRTLVLSPDSSECEQLLEPWSESGIMLAPVVLGYQKGFFPYY
jgi:hypothetical protein